jgi:hypothetical protein
MSCTMQTFGACTVSTCTGSAATPAPQAGAITVSDGAKFNASLTPSTDGTYAVSGAPNILLPGGEMVTVNAAGGDIPAFSGAIEQPLTLLVTSPTDASSGTFSWPRANDLNFSFDRGTVGVELEVQVAIAGKSLTCHFASQAGMATVPTAALSELPVGVTLDVFTSATKRVQAGNYSVDLIAFDAATNVAKTAGVHVTLQ